MRSLLVVACLVLPVAAQAPRPKDVSYRGATITIPADGWYAKADDRDPDVLVTGMGSTLWVWELPELPEAGRMLELAERGHLQETKVTKVEPHKQHGKAGHAFRGTAVIRPTARRGGGTFTVDGVVLGGYSGKRAFAMVAFTLDGIGLGRLDEARRILASLR